MQKYSEKKNCPKCNGKLDTTYDSLHNLMIRMCQTCGHTFKEKPLDENKLNESNLLLG